MRLIWAVLCRHAIVEQDTNTLSLMDVIEQITIEFNDDFVPAPIEPNALPIALELITLWQRGPDRSGGTFKIALRTPHGTTAPGHATGTIEQSPARRARITTRVPNLPWRGEGEYAFVVQFSSNGKWKTVADVPFLLKMKGTQALPHAAPSPAPEQRADRKPGAKRQPRKRKR